MKYLFTIALLAFSIVCHGQIPYFCTKENTFLEYTRSYTSGKVKWYHRMEFHKVWLSDGNGTVKYSSRLMNGKRKPYTDTPAVMTACIENGNVTLNVAESMAAIFRTVLSEKTKIETVGGKTSLPCNMSPGDTLPDVYCTITVLGMTMRVSVTERKVLGPETITTPAGTFQCMVIEEHKTEKGMGRNRVTTARTWYSPDMGMIRHDTYNRKGILDTSEVLTTVGSL